MEDKIPIKVSKKIKPVHPSLRETFELIIGNKYYVCEGQNLVYPCILEKIIENNFALINENNSLSFVEIKVLKEKGKVVTETWLEDEIGRTPEEAVINTVK